MPRVTKAERDHREFGAALRALRKARRYTLKDVARATGDLVDRHARSLPDSARVSDAYLAQLETGRPFAVSLPKLLLLAATYNTSAEELIRKAPEPLRSRRLADLRKWMDDERFIPPPLVRLPQHDRLVDIQVDALLAHCARGVHVPLEWEDEFKDRARTLVTSVALAALVVNHPARAREYWKARRGRAQQLTSEEPYFEFDIADALLYYPAWERVANDCFDWLIYEALAVEDAVDLLSSWHLDFAQDLVTCHFREPSIDQRHGFDEIPGPVVVGLSWRLLANILASVPHPAAPPAPELMGVIHDYVEHLVRPCAVPDDDIEHGRWPLNAGTISARLREFDRHIRDLVPLGTDVDAALAHRAAAAIRQYATIPASPIEASSHKQPKAQPKTPASKRGRRRK